MSSTGEFFSLIEALDEQEWVIIVIGRTGVGKTTFIDECTDEGYFAQWQANSSESHLTKKFYLFRDQPSVRKLCKYREIPAVLDLPMTSASLLQDIAAISIAAYNKTPVAGILYVHDRGDDQDSSLHAHLEFTQCWIGGKCGPSTVLILNPKAQYKHDSQPDQLSIVPDIGFLWRKHMGPEARGPLLWERDLSESRDIAQAAVNGPGQILKLQTEIFKGKQLRETTVGKQYVRQLELWIKDAKKKRTEEKKKVKQEKRKKEESPELQQLAEYIAGLENQKASWKKLKFP